ncbi:hypothetical protein NFI96_004461 [Prochilodus magdalenae]|nr:hypothetical protein NFI96_004461 [Prochilodus magdalenae]
MRAAAPRLLRLRQGPRSAADYAVDFRTLGAESGWNKEALVALFYQGLNERLKEELAAQDLPPTLEKLYYMAIAIDNRLRERIRSWGAHFRALPPLPPSPVFPQSTPQGLDDPSQCS